MKPLSPTYLRFFALGLGALAALYLFLRFSPMPEMKLKGDYSTAFLASDGSLLRLTLSPSGKYRLPLKLDQVSPQVTRGFVAYEEIGRAHV